MQLAHEALGLIDVVVNQRARRYVFRATDDGRIKMTVPARTTEKDWRKAVDGMYPRLLALIEKKRERKQIDATFRIDQPDFRMALREGMVPRVQARMSEGTLDVVYPKGTDFGKEELQVWLEKVAGEAVRHQAKRVLPGRLMALAQQLGLTVKSVTVRNSHGRWGSCSSRRSINLSMYLVLLPTHLQRYVMLHELTHLLHMDHSPAFWAQLDAFCGGSSKALRQEMKRYDTSLFFRR